MCVCVCCVFISSRPLCVFMSKETEREKQKNNRSKRAGAPAGIQRQCGTVYPSLHSSPSPSPFCHWRGPGGGEGTDGFGGGSGDAHMWARGWCVGFRIATEPKYMTGDPLTYLPSSSLIYRALLLLSSEVYIGKRRWATKRKSNGGGGRPLPIGPARTGPNKTKVCREPKKRVDIHSLRE